MNESLVFRPRTQKLRWWEWPLLFLALGVFLAQLLIASPQKSAAFDEQYHLTAGYSYLRTGDFRMATTHPPLMGMIGALALLGREEIALPLESPAWQTGDRFLYSDIFLWEANADPVGMVEAARRPIMAVGLILIGVLFVWARQLIGPTAGWLVLILAVFDPNLLGNSRVVTTDLGLAAFLTLAVWRLWCWLERRTLLNLFLTGVSTGLAVCAKYTGLFIWPALLLIILLYPLRAETDSRWRRLLGLIGIGLVALGVVWALFRFDFGRMNNDILPIPLPAPFYWQQLYNTFFRIVDLQGARYDFFWGEASNQGWWYYFPVALAIKTPLPLLICASLGFVLGLRQTGWRKSSLLWTVPVLFLLLGLTGILTIGYRHILPMVPLLLLMAGYLTTVTWPTRTDRRSLAYAALLLVLIGWAVFGSLRRFPHQEAFFNELAGDWTNWSNLLVDSNLDWGQDLPALRQVMAERGIAEVNLAYFGKAVPERYGVTYRPLYGYLRFVDGIELAAYNPYRPEPGWYAISATSLRLGLHQRENLDLYAYFRERVPDARAGYSIYLYHVVDPPGTPVVRKTVVGTPLFLLPAAELGTPATRTQVKWTQDPEIQIIPLGENFAPSALADFQWVNANFSDRFTLLGYQPMPANAARGQPWPMQLIWQVGSQAVDQPAPTRGSPLSAFVHLTVPGAPDQKIAQFDGWGVALRGLEPGDVIIQPLTLEIAAEAAPGTYDLLAGLYSPQNGARLMVDQQDQTIDFAHLGELVVE